MIKLNAGISRKVGEPGYSSRGASVNVELEVESNLINDPNSLLDRIRRLFAMARDAVNEELTTGGGTPSRTNGNRSAAPNRDASGRGPANGTGPRSATASQLNAIRTIAGEQNADPDALAHGAFGVGLNQLTLRQASDLIDQLKSQTNGSRR